MQAEGCGRMAVGDEAVPVSDATASLWWERRWFLALVVFATMVPLIYPPIPPLVDLLGHMGHYRVELDVGHSRWLQQYYGHHWMVMGNLGVDLLIIPLGQLMGLEPAVKLIALATPPLTAVGMLWVAHEVHGRIPPTVFFALPFIYGFPFLFGFVNFTLSVALAFLAFGLWLRLGQLGRTRLRGWLFAPISLLVFFCHVYGWGLLCLMCFSAAVVRRRDRGRSWWRSAIEGGLQTSVMALPLLVIALSPRETHSGKTADWFDWGMKWRWVYAALRDRWGVFDMASLALGALVFAYGIASPDLALSRRLALSTAALAAAFLVLPQVIFASAYADMRLVPYLFAIALLAIRLRPATAQGGSLLAAIGLLFFAGRTVANTASLAIAAKDQAAKLEAVSLMPAGARVASFYGLPESEPWALPRDSHLGALVIVRREGFSNDQWITPGHNMLLLKYRSPGTFASDPSEIVRPEPASDRRYRTIDEALAAVPRDRFDYIWLIGVSPRDPHLLEGLQPVWRARDTVLYRIPPQGRPG